MSIGINRGQGTRSVMKLRIAIIAAGRDGHDETCDEAVDLKISDKVSSIKAVTARRGCLSGFDQPADKATKYSGVSASAPRHVCHSALSIYEENSGWR